MTSQEHPDIQILHRMMKDRRVSGPWRATLWGKKSDGRLTWVFSEEHENKGACGLEVKQTDLTDLVSEVVSNTKNVHVFLEHFVHAVDVQHNCTRTQSTLQNLRSCIKGPTVHYVDPRTDLVAILPNGKIFEAIVHYANYLHSQHNNNNLAVKLLLYETFIHPLLSIVNPDGVLLEGRLNTVLQRYLADMTVDQTNFFREKWIVEVIGSVEHVRRVYHDITNYSKKPPDITALLEAYTDMVNNFTDLWLLANFFVAENKGMTGSIVYAGSKHSLHFEKYLAEMEYELLEQFTNRDLSACLSLRY